MTSGSAQTIVRVVEVLVLWTLAAVPAYQVFGGTTQIQTKTLVGILAIGGILGLVAGASRIKSPLVRLAILVLGILLVWPPAMGWLASLLPPQVVDPASRTPGGERICLACDELLRSASGGRGLIVIIDVVVMVAAVPLAIWRRPPSRTPDGAAIRTSQVMTWGPLACIVGGPVLGLFLWLNLAPGDIYGGPLMLGVLLALVAFLAFVGYSAFYALIGRPGLSASMAIAYAAVVVLTPLVLAASPVTGRAQVQGQPPGNVAQFLMPVGVHDGSTVEWPAKAVGEACYANGWAWDQDSPDADVAIRILATPQGGAGTAEEVWLGPAGEFRADLPAAGIGDGTASFYVDLRSRLARDQPYEILVQGQDLQSGAWVTLSESPRTILCTR